MDFVEVLAYSLHSLFAGVWVGSVLFVTWAVLPLAREGGLNAAPLDAIVARLRTVSRASAVVLFLTGSHLAAAVYTSETLTETTPGHLVLAMIVLWLVLMAAVEVGTKRVRAGTDRDKVRDPARRARPVFLLASIAAVGLLMLGGLLSAARLGFFTI